MEELLKPGYRKILALFYEDKKASLHLREIARKTGMNENSIFRFVNRLQKEGILTSKKDGNLKKFSIFMNSKVFALFSFFDIEKFDRLPSLRKRAIDYFLKKIGEKPIFVILFGSTAKETFSKTSDIDLLLIFNKKINTEKEEEYSESQTGLNISVFQISYKEFIEELRLKEDSVVQSALNTGYPIINHIKFYEALLNGEG